MWYVIGDRVYFYLVLFSVFFIKLYWIFVVKFEIKWNFFEVGFICRGLGFVYKFYIYVWFIENVGKI